MIKQYFILVSIVCICLSIGSAEVSSTEVAGQFGPSLFVSRLSWSPDGNYLAVLVEDQERYVIAIYDSSLQPTAVIDSLPEADEGYDLSWNSSSTQIAVGIGGRQMSGKPITEVWDVTTSPPAQVLTYQDKSAADAGSVAVAWRPDHQQIVYADGKVDKVLNLDTGIVDYVLEDEARRPIFGLRWNPSGDYLAGISTAGLYIWESNSYTLAYTLLQDSVSVDAAWSSSGFYIAMSYRNSVRIWDATREDVITTLESPENITRISTVEWQREYVVATAITNAIPPENELLVWNAMTGELVNTISVAAIIRDIALHPTENKVVYGTESLTPVAVDILPSGCDPTQTISAGEVTGFINAINTANSNPDADVIGLETGTYTFTTAYLPLNALPAITSDITICSPEGATLTRQAGSPLFGFFEVSAGGNLTLENLTLSGGDVGNDTGGALVNEGGTVTLNNVTFTNNHANTGGAIDNESGSLTITNSTFQNNQATFGGAIDNDAGNMLSISGSTFTSNTADLDGGAIHNDGGTLTVMDSTFTSNTASRYGGALDNTGSATISGSTFSGNSASWSGGAIRNTNTLTVNNGSVLENNAATLGENNEGWGGGVYNTSSGTATISSSILSENAAIQGGGIRNHGSLTLNENTQLTGNSASSRGGGIYNAGGTIILTNSALVNNTATGDGGAIYTTSLGSQVTITGSTLSGNTAGASGGAIRSSQGMTLIDSVFSGNSATSSYGSLYLTSSSTTTAHNSCFSGNSATSVGFTGTTMQDFTGNWWGAANGPSGSGPGSGDAVNNRINFASFLTAGCPHP